MKGQIKVSHKVINSTPGIFHIPKAINRKTQGRGKSQILLCHGMARTLPSQVHPCSWAKASHRGSGSARHPWRLLTECLFWGRSLPSSSYLLYLLFPAPSHLYLSHFLSRLGHYVSGATLSCMQPYKMHWTPDWWQGLQRIYHKPFPGIRCLNKAFQHSKHDEQLEV